MWEKLSVKSLRDIASKYKALHSLGNISKQKKSVLLETLKKVMEFRGNTLFTKAEHGNKKVVKVEEEDEPKKSPTPKAEEPAPKAKAPAPKAKAPTPKAEEPAPKAKKPDPKVIGVFENAYDDMWVITDKAQVLRLFEKDKSYVVLKKAKSIKEAFDWLFLKHRKKDLEANYYSYNLLNSDFKRIGGENYDTLLKKYNLELTETSIKNKMIFYPDFLDDEFKKGLASIQKYF